MYVAAPCSPAVAITASSSQSRLVTSHSVHVPGILCMDIPYSSVVGTMQEAFSYLCHWEKEGENSNLWPQFTAAPRGGYKAPTSEDPTARRYCWITYPTAGRASSILRTTDSSSYPQDPSKVSGECLLDKTHMMHKHFASSNRSSINR
jgi:hypothetical protein